MSKSSLEETLRLWLTARWASAGRLNALDDKGAWGVLSTESIQRRTPTLQQVSSVTSNLLYGVVAAFTYRTVAEPVIWAIAGIIPLLILVRMLQDISNRRLEEVKTVFLIKIRSHSFEDWTVRGIRIRKYAGQRCIYLMFYGDWEKEQVGEMLHETTFIGYWESPKLSAQDGQGTQFWSCYSYPGIYLPSLHAARGTPTRAHWHLELSGTFYRGNLEGKNAILICLKTKFPDVAPHALTVHRSVNSLVSGGGGGLPAPVLLTKASCRTITCRAGKRLAFLTEIVHSVKCTETHFTYYNKFQGQVTLSRIIGRQNR